jgi:hypothetical protein
MTLATIAASTAREGQLSWPMAAVAAWMKRNGMQAFCPQRPPARPPWGWHVEAGPATSHHPAGDDPGRSH